MDFGPVKPVYSLQGAQRLYDHVSQAFSRGGALTANGYLPQRQQAAYAEALCAAVCSGWEARVSGADRAAVTVAPAETGIGKTLAYMVVLAGYCAVSGERAMVSTYTLNLLRQILGGDDTQVALNIAEAAFGHRPVVKPRFGRANFVDRIKAKDLIADLAHDGVRVPSEFVEWIENPPADSIGLLSEWTDDGRREWPKGVNPTDIALGYPHSPEELRERAPAYLRHIDESKTADILVTSHASAIINARLWDRLLDPAEGRRVSVLLCDEADRLPSAAESALSERIRPIHVSNLAKSLGSDPQSASALEKAMNETEEVLAEVAAKMAPDERTPFEMLFSELDRDVRVRLHDLFSEAAASLEQVLYGYKASSLKSPDSGNDEAAAKCRNHLERFNDLLEYGLLAENYQTGEAVDANGSRTRVPIRYYGFDANTPRGIRFSPARRQPTLVFSDLHPGAIMGRYWKAVFGDTGPQKGGRSLVHTAILTSATINAGEIDLVMDYGIPKQSLNRLDVFSPLRFGRASFVLANPNGPKPSARDAKDSDSLIAAGEYTNPEWLRCVAKTLINMPEGHLPSLVLMTSYHDVAGLRDEIRKMGNGLGSFVFHGRGEKISEHIANLVGSRHGLLVTPAAWEGVSPTGPRGAQAIRSVVICRLPFCPPDELYRKAFIEAYRAWKLSTLPAGQSRASAAMQAVEAAEGILVHKMKMESVNRFAQGFGRGIRGQNHDVVFYVLDPRFHEARWKAFRESIPKRFHGKLEFASVIGIDGSLP